MTNKPRQQKSKPKRRIGATLYWLILVVTCLILFFVFFSMPMFPRYWSFILLAVLAVIAILTGFISVKFPKNILVKILNILLSVFLLICSILLPYYKEKVSDLFTAVLGNTVKINCYVMADSYREKYPDIFYGYSAPDKLSDFTDYIFITTVALDPENQNFAINEIKKETGWSDFTRQECQSAHEAVENLYNGTGDVLIMSENFESLIAADTEGYENFHEDTRIVATFYRTIKPTVLKSDTRLTDEPFIVFFGGNDEEGDLKLDGRTDVDMIVTVNPNTYQIAIVNLPRDSYVNNPAWGSSDKLTHLGMTGIDNTLNGLSQYLGQDINNYVLINFTTFRNIIDALGGVDVYNEYAFTALDGQYFPEGEIHLQNEYALMFVRERYSLPDGDFGRNYHQQQVMSAIIDKITSVEVISHFDDLLDNLKGKFLTNLSDDSIYALCRKQLEQNINWNVVRYHVIGETGMEECATAPGEMLSVVYPYTNQVDFVAKVMSDVVNGQPVVQEELPAGSYSHLGEEEEEAPAEEEYVEEYEETYETGEYE